MVNGLVALRQTANLDVTGTDLGRLLCIWIRAAAQLSRLKRCALNSLAGRAHGAGVWVILRTLVRPNLAQIDAK